VAGPEVEYFALAHLPRATAGEGIAVVPLFLKYHRVWFGHMERPAIDLRLGNVEGGRNARGDWMFRKPGMNVARLAFILDNRENASGQFHFQRISGIIALVASK